MVEQSEGVRVDMGVGEHRVHLAGWPMESGRDRGVPQIPVSAATRPEDLGQQPRTTE